jgi:hypothetical protein
MVQKSFILNHLKNIKEQYQLKGIVIVGIFGSFARDEASSSSDIDILYETKKGTKDIYDKKVSLKDELKELFHTNIDLANIKYLKPFAKDEIMKDLVYV